MPDSQAIVQSAQLASFAGLSNCLAVLFARRQSLGDMVFTFAEEGEECAHSLVVCLRSPYLSALVTMTRMAPASSSAPLRLSDPLSRENFVLLLHWMYTGKLPATLGEEESLSLLAAANFITADDCVRLVVAHVVSTLLQVENALPWLRLALEGVNGAHDATLKLSSLGMLVSNAQRVKEAGVAGFSFLRETLLQCTNAELAALPSMNCFAVHPADEAATAWKLTDVRLKSSRKGFRAPVTFLNLRSYPVLVLWIDFDGNEHRYQRSVDNVDSLIQPGGHCTWSSVTGHMWRVYGAGEAADSKDWLGGLTVAPLVASAADAPPIGLHPKFSAPASGLRTIFEIDGYLAPSLSAAVEARAQHHLAPTWPSGQLFIIA